MLRTAHSPRLLPSLLLLLLAFSPAVGLGAQATTPVTPHHGRKLAKQQISELENQWRTATLAGDTATMDKLLSDDFVGISWTGQVNTKTMQLDRLRTRSLAIKRMDVSDLKIKVVGTVAIVTSRAVIEGTSDGQPMTGDFRYTRVYQRLPSGAWRVTNFEATRIPNADRSHHG